MDVWAYREASWATTDLTGFGVEALDGSIGKIDEASAEVGSSHLVVDTGPWIFGKKVLLPAGIVGGIDETDEKVFVYRTKEEIKNAPEYDESMLEDDEYRTNLGTYYGPGGSGYRDWNDTIV
jgi:hypothetical protein